ncbi:MAG: hypothetical protein LBD42_07625 [Desulfovibrio sp.]|jgi:hypothetical protein|nr:hypothetical protein [Desulfovibrio sp.]
MPVKVSKRKPHIKSPSACDQQGRAAHAEADYFETLLSSLTAKRIFAYSSCAQVSAYAAGYQSIFTLKMLSYAQKPHLPADIFNFVSSPLAGLRHTSDVRFKKSNAS